MFTLNWPTKWAAKGYTSFTFGFPSAEEARHWHARLADCIELVRIEKAAAASSSGGAGGNFTTLSSGRTPGLVSGNTTPMHTSNHPPSYTYSYSVGGAGAGAGAGGAAGAASAGGVGSKQRSVSGAGALPKSTSLQHAVTPTQDRGPRGASVEGPRSYAGDFGAPSSPGGMAGVPPLAPGAGAGHRRSMTTASEPGACGCVRVDACVWVGVWVSVLVCV